MGPDNPKNVIRAVRLNDKYSPDDFQPKRAKGAKIMEAMLSLYHNNGSGGKY